ncbi:MAG: PIG-L family deacetylase [Bacteroidetes bacterium]|nr:MAG: PIG-L family deacetylase [Bacteroidota bacterium]
MLLRTLTLSFLLALMAGGSAVARQAPPRVLIVTAHPDDEALFAATVYQITHALGGAVDLALVTDGSGGYTYAGLSEPLYHLDLTDEHVARHYLPAIRKQELMAGGRILGLRNYFFLDALDHQYTLDVDTVLTFIWDKQRLLDRLTDILRKGRYDFVLTHLPLPTTHGHHKGATLLALEAAARLPDGERPVLLGSFIASRTDTTTTDFVELPGYPRSRIRQDRPPFTFDRTRTFGPRNRLTYQIIVNWVIAEHKSQGTMQLLMNRGEVEQFWLYALNAPDAEARAQALFEHLTTATLPFAPPDTP